MGCVYRGTDGKPKRAKNWKKAFVQTTHKFDPFLNTEVWGQRFLMNKYKYVKNFK